MQMRALSLVVVVTALAPLPACELFGIRCAADADCPDDLPFCVAEFCSATDSNRPDEGEGEEGEGEEGEGETVCSSDSDCSGSYCYDVPDDDVHFEAARVDTCVPGEVDDVSCPEVGGLFSATVPANGQALFKATATFASGDCGPGEFNVNVSALVLGRTTLSGQTVFVAAPGASSPNFASASVSTNNGVSGEVFGFDFNCYPEDVGYVAIAFGDSSPTSNGLCVPVASAP